MSECHGNICSIVRRIDFLDAEFSSSIVSQSETVFRLIFSVCIGSSVSFNRRARSFSLVCNRRLTRIFTLPHENVTPRL